MSEEKIKQIVREEIGAYAEGDAVLWINAEDVEKIAAAVAERVSPYRHVFAEKCEHCLYRSVAQLEGENGYKYVDWCTKLSMPCEEARDGYYC